MANPNLSEIGKIVRAMQDESLAKHLAANNFNQEAANIVTQGANDKLRAKGWPVTPPKTEQKKML